jgi:hypothetical protein
VVLFGKGGLMGVLDARFKIGFNKVKT